MIARERSHMPSVAHMAYAIVRFEGRGLSKRFFNAFYRRLLRMGVDSRLRLECRFHGILAERRKKEAVPGR